jgi:hypothetical protein
MSRSLPVCGILFGLVAAAEAQTGAQNGEWRTCGAKQERKLVHC